MDRWIDVRCRSLQFKRTIIPVRWTLFVVQCHPRLWQWWGSLSTQDIGPTEAVCSFSLLGHLFSAVQADAICVAVLFIYLFLNACKWMCVIHVYDFALCILFSLHLGFSHQMTSNDKFLTGYDTETHVFWAIVRACHTCQCHRNQWFMNPWHGHKDKV